MFSIVICVCDIVKTRWTVEAGFDDDTVAEFRAVKNEL